MVKANLAGFALLLSIAAVARAATIDPPASASPRVQYGIDQLRKALPAADDRKIVFKQSSEVPKEGFNITSGDDRTITIASSDDSGALYGCLELVDQINDSKSLPATLNITESPLMKLRGPCIGMQKPYVLPGRKVYEYPYTNELFPFFYDKQLWTEYLDFLAANRFNTLYLWNGHPFASLVRLKDYPESLEVSEEQFAKNVEMYRWIATECDRRGIWLVQMFYNILLSKPFAEKHGLETQLKAPDPIAADYTRKSIAEFVKQYPHVGLMICMGEALQGDENQKQWLTETILPGIKDGMKLAGLSEEPPVVVRTHATDLRKYMKDALAVYKNLYTEAKFNGESLTTWEPRGVRQQVHLDMSRLGSTHLMNVHILANLEPFRYGDQKFIKKSIRAGYDRLGARGLHLYPLFFWDWPVSPDKTEPRLLQFKRDWIWFEAWGRYAWNPDIPDDVDHKHWIARLTEMYGSPDAAEQILSAYNNSGECAPRILRRFGITEGNRQSMSLGMTLDQLVHPERFGPFPELWESQSPPGERLQEYVEREWKKQPHEGETPPQIIEEVLDFSAKAVTAIDAADATVTSNRDEYLRIKNDVHCIRAMSQNYAAKANAAICVLRFGYSKDVADMVAAQKYLAESLDHFRTLTNLTKDTYLAANAMQSRQRKIPVVGGDAQNRPDNYLWSQLLPVYEKELVDFTARVDRLKQGQSETLDETSVKPLAPTPFTLISKDAETYTLAPGERPFADRKYIFEALAPELTGLTGIRFSHTAAKEFKPVAVEIDAAEPVQVLIGYFKSPEEFWRKPPNLETDALAADQGGVEPLIQNAATITECPALDVHAMTYPAGKIKIEPRGQGSFLILGVIKQSEKIQKRDAHRRAGG